MRRLLHSLSVVLLVAVWAAPRPAEGQRVEATLEAAGTGDPVSGAFVVLRDSAGLRRDADLTGDGGGFVLTAPEPGLYRLSVRRIGLREWTSDPFRLESGETLRRSITVPRRPVRLGTLRVSAERRCLTDPSEARAARRIWQEARTALEVARWSREHREVSFTKRRFVRRLDPTSGDVERVRERTRRGGGGPPYRSLPADSLAAVGYARSTPDSLVFYGPDAGVLLSESFVRTHCFGTDRARGEGGERLVGLTFRPARGRREPEIRGVLWVEEATGELRRVEYEYVNLPEDAVSAARYGGEIRFDRLEDGPWYVARWEMRLPMKSESARALGGPGTERVGAVRVAGGEVTEVRRGRSGRRRPTGARMFGVVWDSIRDGPMAGATVRVSGTGRDAVTDSSGRFSLRGVPPGRRRVTVEHPLLAVLGVRLPAEEVIARRGQSYRLQLAVPEAEMDTDPAAVVGTVYDSLRRRPLANAVVRVAGGGPADTTDAEGHYALTEISPGSHGLVLEHPLLEGLGLELEPEDVRVPEEGGLLRRQLGLPGPRRVLAELCPDSSLADGAGAILGLLRRPSGSLFRSGEVAVAWGEAEGGQQRKVRVPPAESGRFRMCGVPTGRRLRMQAAAGPARSEVDTATISPERRLLVRPLTLRSDSGAAAAPGIASLIGGEGGADAGRRSVLLGRVTGADASRPLESARVRVPSTGARAVTDSVGLFVIDGLPPGRRTVEVEYLGYRSRRVSIFLPPGDTVRTSVGMQTDPVPLPDLRVQVEERERRGRLARFRERKESGTGKYIGPEEIRETPGSSLHRAFQQLPGVEVMKCSSLVPNCYRIRSGRRPKERLGGRKCETTYWVDGTRVDLRNVNRIPKSRVAGIEVYSGGAVPSQYGGATADCTVVLIWTRPGGDASGSGG